MQGLAGPQHAPPASAAGVDAAGSSTHRGPKKGPGRHKDASKASAADTHGVSLQRVQRVQQLLVGELFGVRHGQVERMEREGK
jgi:hypothetical protein